MACKFCAWLCDWLGARVDYGSMWRESEKWERDNSNEWDLWSAETDENRQLIDQAYAIWDSDPEAAFGRYLQAADAGSIWAMQTVAGCYDHGAGVAADFGQAKEYYRRALRAGSSMATIHYARLLARHGDYDDCEKVLEDGMRANFIPAYFWLAWYRHKQSRTRATRRAIRPLLESAARMGHPAAKSMLRGMMMVGDLGIRAIPRGFFGST